VPKLPKKSAASFSWNWQKGHEPKSTTAVVTMMMMMMCIMMTMMWMLMAMPFAFC